MTNTDVPIAVRQEGGKTIVDIKTSNVDFRNAEMLKGALAELVEQGNKKVLLNLSEVSFMDSSGLSVLLSGKRVTEEAGGSFEMFGLQNYVNNLINLTNLNKTIPVYESEGQAVQS